MLSVDYDEPMISNAIKRFNGCDIVTTSPLGTLRDVVLSVVYTQCTKVTYYNLRIQFPIEGTPWFKRIAMKAWRDSPRTIYLDDCDEPLDYGVIKRFTGGDTFEVPRRKIYDIDLPPPQRISYEGFFGSCLDRIRGKRAMTRERTMGRLSRISAEATVERALSVSTISSPTVSERVVVGSLMRATLERASAVFNSVSTMSSPTVSERVVVDSLTKDTLERVSSPPVSERVVVCRKRSYSKLKVKRALWSFLDEHI